MHTKFHNNALTCHVERTIWLLHGSIRDCVFNIKKNKKNSYFQYKPRKVLKNTFLSQSTRFCSCVHLLVWLWYTTECRTISRGSIMVGKYIYRESFKVSVF